MLEEGMAVSREKKREETKIVDGKKHVNTVSSWGFVCVCVCFVLFCLFVYLFIYLFGILFLSPFMNSVYLLKDMHI